MGRRVFSLELARQVQQEMEAWLRPVCGRVQVTGSVRREKPLVHDLDLLLLVRDMEQLDQVLVDLGFRELIHIRQREKDHRRMVHCATGLPTDLHLVEDMTHWHGRLVMTTGSKKHLDRLRAAARARTFILRDDGCIQKAKKDLMWPHCERGIYQALGIPFCRPKERAT